MTLSGALLSLERGLLFQGAENDRVSREGTCGSSLNLVITRGNDTLVSWYPERNQPELPECVVLLLGGCAG